MSGGNLQPSGHHPGRTERGLNSYDNAEILSEGSGIPEAQKGYSHRAAISGARNWWRAAVGKELGVSRTPVREAFRQLELEGLVEVVPHRGTFVDGISAKDIHDIYSDPLPAGRDCAPDGPPACGPRRSWRNWRRRCICPSSHADRRSIMSRSLSWTAGFMRSCTRPPTAGSWRTR